MGGPQLKVGERPPFDSVVYVNGLSTDAEDATRAAVLIGDRIGCGVRLIYNDLTWPVVDWIATAVEKAGDAGCSVNAATDTLTRVIRQQVENGESIHIIGHSAGSLCILNAVNAVAEGWKNRQPAEQVALLKRIHALTVGGATLPNEDVFANGWPGIGSLHHLRDARDSIANVWGEGYILDAFTCEPGNLRSDN